MKLPGLNRSVMTPAAIQICEMALREGWPDRLAKFGAGRVGLYAYAEDPYDFPPKIYSAWSPGGDIRSYLRENVLATLCLSRCASITTGSLSILLKLTGPVQTVTYAADVQQTLGDFAQLDFAEGRIDAALFADTINCTLELKESSR